MEVDIPAAVPDWHDYKFAGWVPTTTGHLSFSAIGVDRPGFYYGVQAWNRKMAETLVSDPNTPDVFAFQWRRNREYGLARRILNRLFARRDPLVADHQPVSRWTKWRDLLFRPHTSQYFILHAKMTAAETPFLCNDAGGVTCQPQLDEQGAIFGEVWQGFRRPGSKSEDWRAFTDGLYALTALNQDSSGQTDFAAGWRALSTAMARTDACPLEYQTISFVLYRTGELRILREGDRIGLEAGDSGELPPSVCRQAYYFIKDIAHRHHHHREDADQGLRLIACDDDDLRWRRGTLWDLARAAGKLRREGPSLARRRSASGVAAYAEAFQANLAQHKRVAGSFATVRELATYNFAHQRSSIASANDTASFKRQGAGTLAIAFVAFVMAFSALYHSASAIRWNAGDPTICVFDSDWRYVPVAGAALMFLALFDLLYNPQSHIHGLWLKVKLSCIVFARKPMRAIWGYGLMVALVWLGWFLAGPTLRGLDWPLQC